MNLSDLPWDNILEILGFSVGLLYLWWEYHADSRLWYASIVMPAISMWVYLGKGLYADFAITIYYFVMSLYGWYVWTRARHKGTRIHNDSPAGADNDTGGKQDMPVTHIPPRYIAGCTAVFLAIWLALYLVLEYMTDSNVPAADAFTTALSITGAWMLARKYLEQWIVWILVDAVSSSLYVYKEIYFYAVLYGIYTIIAVLGYRKWRSMM